MLRSAPTQAAEEPTPLTGLELATRLAFFLWSSGPDQRLIDLGAAGTLQDDKVLAREVRAILDEDRPFDLDWYVAALRELK